MPASALPKAGVSNFEILQREIIARSDANSWEPAKAEWALACVYWQATGGQCLCTHKPIKEICVLRNSKSEQEAIVGNCCVKRFLENISSEIIFAAVRRVNLDGAKALNREVIKFARNLDWISAWDHKFYVNTWRKRKMTERQGNQRIRINNLILRRMRDPDAESEEEESPWKLDESTLESACADGRISNWEKEFYIGNLSRKFVSDRQQPIKRRIEAKIEGTWKSRRRGQPEA